MKPTLIIVDDVELLRTQWREALGADFEIVAEAADGLEAIDLCRQFQPQLVLMDVVMPRMSGIEATRLIIEEAYGQESHASGGAPKVVILSGLKEESVVLQAIEAGASDYLFKPIAAEKLRNVLWSFLKSAA